MAENLNAVSPLEEFVLTPRSRGGLGMRNKAQLASEIHNIDSSIKKANVASDISKYFDYGRPLQVRFKDKLYKLAGRDLRAALERAIEQHEEEFRRRQDPIGLIKDRFHDAESLIFIGLEPISANFDTAPPSLRDLLEFSLQEVMNGTLSVIMAVPSIEMARTIWVTVSATLAEWAKVNQSTTAAARDHIDSRFQVVLLPRRMCVHTTFVFDSHKPNATGYLWYMPWDWRFPAKMPPKVLDAWKTEYLAVIEAGGVDGITVTKIARIDVAAS